jgi:hypothetical protein
MKGYNALHSRSQAEADESYARIGLTAAGERPQYVHIDPDDYAGKIAAELAAQPSMTEQQCKESKLRITYYEKRLAEQARRTEPDIIGEAVACAYGACDLEHASAEELDIWWNEIKERPF